MDRCLRFAAEHQSLDPELALQFLVKFSGIAKKTPRARIVRAIAEELVDMAERALLEIQTLDVGSPRSAAAKARVELDRAVREGASWAASDEPVSPQIAFPRAELEHLLEEVEGTVAGRDLAEVLRRCIERHRSLERRLRWLLDGTSFEQLSRLDPLRDSDQIFHALSSTFRVESRVVELLAINRIAQSTSLSVLVRSTQEAETNGVHRFYDTWGLVANFFEWGEDSKRGRAAAERMRQIHGRYYIPNSGMKYVLLETAFTWLDGIDRIGHRPLLDVERRGYFHAYVKLGLATNIAEIDHDYDAMYRWYREFNLANARHHPLKTDTFERFVKNSMTGFDVPGMDPLLLTAARVGMDDAYRSSLAYASPTAAETAAVRSVFFTLGRTLDLLPRTPFIRSLQNNPARSDYTRPNELGVGERSKHLPTVRPDLPNGGFPNGQRPITNAADIVPTDLPVFSAEEIREHASVESLWVVIAGEVYDLTVFAQKHPGGLAALLAVAGGDATHAFERAGHSAATQVFKLNYRIGRVSVP